MQNERRIDEPYQATGPAEGRNAVTLMISSQHLSLDFCVDAPAAEASREEHRLLLDPIATVSVCELQVMHLSGRS